MGLGRLSVQVLCQTAPLIISRARKRNFVFLARNIDIFAKTLVFYLEILAFLQNH